MPATAISAEPLNDGAVTPGRTRYTRPASAVINPHHSRSNGFSPDRSPAAIIVNCTAANKINAPVPALRLRYAKEKVIAYRNSSAPAIQPPRAPGLAGLLIK